jgi:predicted GIY-YIG superfamily endonuclease
MGERAKQMSVHACTASGTIYLLHFDRPYRHARHYIGYTDDLDSRIATHRAGNGARLIAVISAAGIGFTVARTWTGDRNFERRLKRRKDAPRLCPICREQSADSKSKQQHKHKTDCEAVG